MRLSRKAFALLPVLLLPVTELRANPIYLDDSIPLALSSATAIGAEILVAGLILGAFNRRSVSFILVAVCLHGVTYPLFVATSLWLRQKLPADLPAIVAGEILVTALEAVAYRIYAKRTGLAASPARCAVASLAGNTTSVALGLLAYLTLTHFLIFGPGR